MAISLSDFNKIWASTSPLTPYSFSDANYEEGWNFVGATPPARQMWDSYMKWSDEKQQWIVNNFLPLAGGTMTGAINLANGGGYLTGFSSGAYLYGNPTNTNNDSMLVLYTNSNASGYLLQAGDGTNRKRLIGKADGTFTWDGKNVLTDKVQAINDLSTIITFNSGYTLRGGTLHLIAGFLVMMKVGVNFANTVSANASVTIGTIASTYRPPNDAFGGGVDCTIAIGSDGSVSLRPFVSKASASWSWVTILYTLI